MSVDNPKYPFMSPGARQRGTDFLEALRDTPITGTRPFYDQPVPTRFEDLELPQILGIEFADFSHELDESLGDRKVSVTHSVAFGGHGSGLGMEELQGYNLRQVMRRYSTVPILGSLVQMYHVGESAKGADDDREYFVNGEIVPTPEEAERRRIPRLAEIMRMYPHKGIPGIFVPLLGAPDLRQQFVMWPRNRVIGVSMLGREIGPAVGIKVPVEK